MGRTSSDDGILAGSNLIQARHKARHARGLLSFTTLVSACDYPSGKMPVERWHAAQSRLDTAEGSCACGATLLHLLDLLACDAYYAYSRKSIW